MILTEDEVKNSKKMMIASFNNLNKIDKIASLKQFDVSTDEVIEFFPFEMKLGPVGKDNFTSARVLGSDAPIKLLIYDEMGYCIKKIIENRDVEISEVVGSGDSIYAKIESEIVKLKYDYYNPSTIFIPSTILDEFRKLGENGGSKLHNKFTRSEFKFDDSTTLDIIHNHDSTKFEGIIILDKNECICTFKPSTEENRLHIEIKESEKDCSKVDLIAKTEINLKIRDPGAIKILIIKKD